MTEFFEAHIHAEPRDWSFDANQATVRADAAEALVGLRRQYRDMAEEELAELAASWRPDDASGPYFVFAAAALGGEDEPLAVSAVFLSALHYELRDGTSAALLGLIGQWSDQRRYAWESGQQPVPVRPPRVAVLLPRDSDRWTSESWDALAALDLESPELDAALLSWDEESRSWNALPGSLDGD